jgi:calcineurin-like phosphoesterase family protein
MKIWLITDTHYGHQNIKKYCGRPDNFEELIIENLKKMVSGDDMLIHLGDVYMGKEGEKWLERQAAEILAVQYLVLGNHDKASKTKYLHWFDGVFDSLSINGTYLSHHGVATLPSDCRNQVYGHHHNSVLPENVAKWENSYRLSVEHEEYKPVLLDTIVNRIAKGQNGDVRSPNDK